VSRRTDSEIEGELRSLLADTFALYMKTKNFHWHMHGRHFRDYHLTTQEICERHNDVATTSLIEVWIDQSERRSWFLGETLSSPLEKTQAAG
jgi:DNA-binding ferritin-like protein